MARSSSGVAAPRSRDATWALTLLTTIYTLGYVDRSIINLLLDPIRQEYHLSDTVMGLITGLGFTAFQTLLAIPMARWADTSRRVGILTAGLLLWSVMTGLSGFATGAIMLAVTRMGVGVGEACLTGPSHSLLSDYYPKERRSRAFSIMAAGGEIGIVLAFLVGGWVSQLYGWRAAFFVAGAPGIIVAVVLHFTLREPPRGAERGSEPAPSVLPVGKALAELLGRPSFVVAVLASMAMGLTIFGVTTWSPTYLRRVYHLDLAAVGTTLAVLRAVLSVTGAVVGGTMTSWCVRRYGVRWFMLVPGIICALGGLALGGFLLAPSLPVAIIFLGLVNMAVGAQLGPVFSLVQTVAPPRSRALAAAIFVSVTQLTGAGVGAVLVGALSDAFKVTHGDQSLRYAMVIPVVGGLLAGLIYVLGSRFMPRDVARAEADNGR